VFARLSRVDQIRSRTLLLICSAFKIMLLSSRITIVPALVSVLVAAAPASAQSPAPGKPEPPPPARVYATLKPTIVLSSAAVESYSQPNATAITAAGNPVMARLPNDGRLSFQAGQSRMGFWLNEPGKVRGQVEIDFVDFGKASPTVASLPRLRIAKVEWEPFPNTAIWAGQDWCIHAPINPHGINLVGALFQAGNTSFMRQQVKLLQRLGSLELVAAVGMQNNNNTPADAAVELSRTPSVALRAAWNMRDAGKLGISGIFSSVRFAPGTDDERRGQAGAVALFGDLTPLRGTNLRFETYAGRNVGNLFLLGLGYGTAKQDAEELGGFISVRQDVYAGEHFLYGMAGVAKVLDSGDVPVAYSRPASGGAPALNGNGPGILRNMGARAGYEFRPAKNLGLLLEGFHYRTRHQLLAEDREGLAPDRAATGVELGMLATL
jgi:hypothetical protein